MDIKKKLDNTHDPIADFINACCSNTIQYCCGLTYEDFVDNTSKINDININTTKVGMIGKQNKTLNST